MREVNHLLTDGGKNVVRDELAGDAHAVAHVPQDNVASRELYNRIRAEYGLSASEGIEAREALVDIAGYSEENAKQFLTDLDQDAGSAIDRYDQGTYTGE